MRQEGPERKRRAPRLVWIRGCIAGNADDSLHLVVERLEVFVGDRPIGHVGPPHLAVERSQAKILAMESEKVAAHVHRAATDAAGDPAIAASFGGGCAG